MRSTAIADAILSEPTDELVLCVRDRHLLGHLFDIAHRAARATGLPTERIPVPAVRRRPRRPWTRLRRGECAPAP